MTKHKSKNIDDQQEEFYEKFLSEHQEETEE